MSELSDPRWFLAAGAVLVAMALAGSVLRRLPLSASMVYLAIGAVLGPFGLALLVVDPVGQAGLLELGPLLVAQSMAWLEVPIADRLAMQAARRLGRELQVEAARAVPLHDQELELRPREELADVIGERRLRIANRHRPARRP